MSTLSVDTSQSGSPSATLSPGLSSHSVSNANSTDPMWGMWTSNSVSMVNVLVVE